MERGHRVTRWISLVTGALGSFPAILASVLLIVVWLLTGPIFAFNDTWQLVINTTTTIITFIMVFVIQNTQNRDGRALQTKLDAIIELLDPEHDNPDVQKLIGIEEKPEQAIKREQDKLH